ncbi:unnamed protein product [Brachionus calyciflorus]|uniref:Uncharacterized protein n=1 Tax=Brachionus calyciflorus TaxID=104777 RepID=A0A814AP27_9BILA|nr:unnamed protein product [Brachionus calyciflorus]
MNRIRNEFLEYYSNLANEIDIKSEKAIDSFKNDDTIVNKINSQREEIIIKVKEVEKTNLNNLNDSLLEGQSCFFIPSLDSLDSQTKTDDNSNFEFHSHIGQLVVINFNLNKTIIKKLIRRHVPKIHNEDSNKFDTCDEFVRFKVFLKLIESKRDESLVDLTHSENNIIAELDLSDDYTDLNENSLSFISTCLNVEFLEKLKIENYSVRVLPKNFFRPLKYLTKLKLSLRNLRHLPQGVFNGLKYLEILKLCDFTSTKIEPNIFKNLISLEKLVLYRVSLKNDGLFRSLKNLKKLVIKNCRSSYFELKSFNTLKNLEYLKFLKNSISQLELYGYWGFKSLKILEIDQNLELYKINPRLEILSYKFYKLKCVNNFKMLKFLNIRKCYFKSIDFLNGLNELEFLDINLPVDLIDSFELVNLPKLKFLVLTCENIPNFNESLNNLQGLELSGCRFLPRDQFVNLVNLDYLYVSHSEFVIKTFINANFQIINQLKYLKYDSNFFFGFIDDEIEKEKIRRDSTLKFFKEPNETVIEIDNYSIEIMGKLKEEVISEKVYFEKYLQVSECVREFFLSSESNYFEKYFRNTQKRRLNFDLTISDESSDDRYDYSYEQDEQNFVDT